MKKYLSVIAVLVLCVCFMFSGCTPVLEMPTGNIFSNGGSVVMVGDYVYYANTFVDYSSLESGDNTEKTTEHNAMYRLKTDDKGFVTRDDDGEIQNVEKVYAKIAGFNMSNMFVVGNYLYFTSPNVHKDNSGSTKFDLTTLFRVKLNGTGLKEIYTTQTSQGKFFLVTEQNPYLLIFDDSKIIKIEIKDNLSGKEVLIEDVLDTVFPTTYSDIDYIYYTKDISEEDKNVGLSGNYLYKLDLSTTQSVNVGKPSRETVTLVAYENNVLYYKKLVDGEALYYSNEFVGGFEATEQQLTVVGEVDGTDSISEFTPINNEHCVYKYDSKIMLDTDTNPLVSEDGATIELVYSDYIYYTTANGLYRINYKSREVQTVALVKDIQTGSCDIAGEYCYFYAKVEGNTTDTYYAHRANNKIIENPSRDPQVDCIAYVLADDIEN